tara:strand:+ start:701 stop:964 length:264 start_codon:yes stop_codon:yes gene_type:complete
MDVNITGNPVLGVLEMVILAIGQRVTHPLFAALQRSAFVDDLTCSLDSAFETNIRKFKIRNQFGADCTGPELGRSKIQVVDFFRLVV